MNIADLPRLGRLSERYESSGDPGAVSTGAGDAGGASYGSYQLATRTGSAAEFVAWLAGRQPAYHDALAGAAPGTPAFGEAWRTLAARDRAGFGQVQHDYILARYYEPARQALAMDPPGLDVQARSWALNDVLWSTAVQHGPRGAAHLFDLALDAAPAAGPDAALIAAVYAERGRRAADGTLVHFPGCSPAVQESLARRFQRELADALAELAGDPDAR